MKALRIFTSSHLCILGSPKILKALCIVASSHLGVSIFLKPLRIFASSHLGGLYCTAVLRCYASIFDSLSVSSELIISFIIIIMNSITKRLLYLWGTVVSTWPLGHSLAECDVPVPGIPGTGNFQERKTFRKKIPQRKTEKKPYGTYRYENVTKVWVGDECAPSELRSQAETQIQAQYDTVTQIQYDPNTQEHKYSMTQIHKNTNTV